MVNEQGFNPSQLDEINDVVQRSGFSDKRRRNLAIRSGMENPGAFQEQNAGYIQEAQQPSEFVGAGRKLAANQNPDSVISSIFKGPLAQHGNEWYSYGDTDYSTAQLGTKGYTLENIGNAKYNILDKDNQNLGTSYGSVADAINYYANSQRTTPNIALKERSYTHDDNSLPITQYGYGGDDDYSPAQWFNSPELAYASLTPSYNYVPRGGVNSAGALEDWEILGQVMSGNLGNANGFSGSHRSMPGDNAIQTIPGLASLYNSQAVINNGQLLGYHTDLGPATPNISGYQNPYAVSRVDPKGNTRSNYFVARDIDPDKWNQYGMFTDDTGGFFTPKENADKLPGWQQSDTAQYSHKSSGMGGTLAKIVGTLLSIFGGPIAPVGYAINAASSLNSGNPLGALASIFGGAMNIGGADLAAGAGTDAAIGGGFYGSDLADFATPAASFSNAFGNINPSLLSAGMGGITSAIKGQNPLLGALGSGLGSFASGQLQKMFDGDTIGKITGGAASTGIKSLFNQNQVIRGAEQGAHSGSLSGFINNNSPSAQNNQQEISPEEKQQLALDLQRKLIQRRQQEQLGGA